MEMSGLRFHELRSSALAATLLVVSLVVACAPAPAAQPTAAPAKAAPAAKPAATSAPAAPAATSAPAASAQAQPTAAPAAKPAASPYYEGKTITVINSGDPGAATDTIPRVTSSQLGKYLPGNPRIEHRNIPGGSGLALLNQMAKPGALKPDGLTILAPGRNWPVFDLAKVPGLAHDARQYEFLAGFGDDDYTFYVLASTGVKTFDQLKAPPVPIRIGATIETNASYIMSKMLKDDNALKVDVIAGVGQSGAEVMLAVDRGEVNGSAETYGSLKRQRAKWLTDGTINILARWGNLNEISPANLPQFPDLVSPRNQNILRILRTGWGTPFVAPKGTPPDVLQTLREGFAKMAQAKDPELLKQAEAQAVVLHYIGPEELQRTFDKLMATPPDDVAEYKRLAGVK
jgi:tripartite-type tricarboxylate transporter receptor subunit TctC